MIVVRHSYIKARRSAGGASGARVSAIGKALGHVKYIQHRPGEDRQRGGREFFTDADEAVSGSVMRQAIRQYEGNGVVIHKLTLAPEINAENEQEFTREVMDALGSRKGLDLEWFAVAHKNTEHHHVHVVVLPKDRNGRQVRFDRHDYDEIKKLGDAYLERVHPHEFREAQRLREDKEKRQREANDRAKEKDRQRRIQEGLELPWLHKKITREQVEPYAQWKKEQLEKEMLERQAKNWAQGGQRLDRPVDDVIEAAGKEWSERNSLNELRQLNDYLWEHKEERVPGDEHRKLVRWIRTKEREERFSSERSSGADQGDRSDSFEYRGARYSKDDSYEKLAGLNKHLQEQRKERLPIDDYQKLRSWIDDKDRARFADAVEVQLKETRKQEWGQATGDPEGGRWHSPVREEMMSYPGAGIIMKLFFTEASIAAELVRSIPLKDQRDRLQERREDLGRAKQDMEAKQRGRSDAQARSRDEDVIDKIDRTIEGNEEAQKQRDRDRKKDKERQERIWDLER